MVHIHYKKYQVILKNKNKKTNPIKKWAKDLNGQFNKEDVQNDIRHH